MKVQGIPFKFDAQETVSSNELTFVSFWRGEQSNHTDIDRFTAGGGSVCFSLGRTSVTGKKQKRKCQKTNNPSGSS
jgi:hypothetical protein